MNPLVSDTVVFFKNNTVIHIYIYMRKHLSVYTFYREFIGVRGIDCYVTTCVRLTDDDDDDDDYA